MLTPPQAAFDLYRASNKDKRLRLADWLGLVNAAGLIGACGSGRWQVWVKRGSEMAGVGGRE